MMRDCHTPSLKIHMMEKAIQNFTGSAARLTVHGMVLGTQCSTGPGTLTFKLHASMPTSKV